MQKIPFKKYFRPVVRLVSGREVFVEKKLSTLFLTVAVAACGVTPVRANQTSRPTATAVPVQFVAVASSSITSSSMAKNAASETPDAAFPAKAQDKSPNAQLNAQDVSQRSALPSIQPRPVASRLSDKSNPKIAASQKAKKPATNANSQARPADKTAAKTPRIAEVVARQTVSASAVDASEKATPIASVSKRVSTPKRVSDSPLFQIVDYSQKTPNVNAATTSIAQAKTTTSSTRASDSAPLKVSATSVLTTEKRVASLPPDSARAKETAENRAITIPTISRAQTPSEAALSRAPLQKVEPKVPQRKPANLSSRARDRFLLAQMETDLRRAQGRLNNANETLSQGQKQLMKVSGTLQQAMLEAGNDARGLHPFVRVAQRYAGTPYVWGGESRKGFDCSGFIIVVMRDLGYRALPHSAAEQFNYGTPIAKPLLKAGDIVFFKNTYKRGVSHVGIYIGRGRFIHAAGTGTGTIVSSLNEPKWILHYAGARRLVRR